MTLEQCVNALDNLLRKNVTYSGSTATLTFKDHSEALTVFNNARAALAEMHNRAYNDAGVYWR